MGKCAVIGYGSWATTLVRQIALGGTSVRWLVTNPDVREGLLCEGRNPKYVPDALIDMKFVELSEDVNDTVRGCDIVLLACPSAYLKTVLEPLTEPLGDKLVVSAIKGIVPDECVTVLEYIKMRYGTHFSNMGVLSGPTHAEEVSKDGISYICAAAGTEETALQIKSLVESKSLIVSTSTDIYGLEYAGVLKNIYAIAAGLATGLGYGDNFLAVLVSACSAEMKRFLHESYPFPRHTNSKEYLGDLLVTCYSTYSRNRRLGQLIGKGCSVKSALNEMTMVAEGYFSARLIRKVVEEKGLQMPIADFVYSVLYGGARPRTAMKALERNL